MNGPTWAPWRSALESELARAIAQGATHLIERMVPGDRRHAYVAVTPNADLGAAVRAALQGTSGVWVYDLSPAAVDLRTQVLATLTGGSLTLDELVAALRGGHRVVDVKIAAMRLVHDGHVALDVDWRLSLPEVV